MKITLDWLKSHIETDLSANQIADALIKLGIEVEEIIDYTKIFDKILVGKILEAEKHPNADKLQVCQVDIGTEKPLNIVCGAKNARQGIYVAVAQVGATIPATKSVLKKGMIRGIESQGMMCSTEELDLGSDDTDGIIELSSNSKIGSSLAEALKLTDVIFDLSITPNRADCFCVRGIARDLAAAGYGKLLPFKVPKFQSTIDNPIDLELKTDKCYYFSTIIINNFCGETPEFIAKRLKMIGQKLISTPVNIANYICFDIGQPMHIFDADKLGNKLTIRESVANERVITLNNSKEETLLDGAIVVASDNEVLTIPGIIGGESTAVSKDTKNLLVESAYFNKVEITKTGQFLKITTDARTRCERGIDPNNVQLAIDYFVYLLSQRGNTLSNIITNGNVASNSITRGNTSSDIITSDIITSDNTTNNNVMNNNIAVSNVKKVGKLPSNQYEITLTKQHFINLTGLTESEYNKSSDLLTNLGCEILEQTTDYIKVKTPSWRHDLQIEADLIEEVLRLIGFDKIKDFDLPFKNYNESEARKLNDQYKTVSNMMNALVYNGYFEVKTMSMIDQQLAELFNKNIIQISDTLSSEFAILRPTLVASHLKNVLQAQNRSQKLVKIFENAKQFNKQSNQIIESNMLTGTIAELVEPRHWSNPKTISVFDIKSDIENLLNMVTTKYQLVEKASEYYHPGRSASYVAQKDKVLAQFGEIHPKILEKLGIKGNVLCFEIFIDVLLDKINLAKPKHIVLSQYQPVIRDFSFILDKFITAGQLIDCIKRLHINEIQDISIFDIYESESLGENKKAIAFEVILQSDTHTLIDDELQSISQKIISAVTEKCNGILRDK